MSERRSLRTMPAGGPERNRMRSALVDAGWEPWGTAGGGWEPWGTAAGGGGWEPWGTAAGGGGWEPSGTAAGGIENDSWSPWSGSATMLHDLTVAHEDIDVLECGICYHPLKPPIFQCAKGHVVCSPCSDMLKDAVNCHVCRVAMPGGYQRCHAMERVVDSVRLPCPHAPYGCDTRTAYHAREEHLLRCPHAPCRCPGDTCGFVGSVATLVNHLTAPHGWPCTTEICAGKSFGVDLRAGFNFLVAVRGSAQYLLLLNVASTPFGHAISAALLDSIAATAISSSAPAATRNTTCELDLKHSRYSRRPRRDYQSSRFQVGCTWPSNGMPDPNASFQFFVPKYAYAGGTEAPVHVDATIFISSS